MSKSTTTIGQIPTLRYDVSDQNLSDAQQEFEALLGIKGVITDPDKCHSRSSNAWMPARQEQKPGMILLPRNTEDVSAITKICFTKRIPITSYAGGTSLPGALISTRGGVCIDFQKMAKIICVHKEDMDAVVQPGVGWRELNTRLEEDNLFFPPDPSPDACLGGMVSPTN